MSRRAYGAQCLRWLAVGATLVMACAEEQDVVLTLKAKDGTTIREAVRDQPTAVLVYAASTCFSCGSSLRNWEALAQAKRLKVLVVLAGTVTDADLRILRIQRVHAVELADNSTEHPVFVPSEFVLLGGRVIQHASGEKEIRKRRLWRMVDADTVRFPGTPIAERMANGPPE